MCPQSSYSQSSSREGGRALLSGRSAGGWPVAWCESTEVLTVLLGSQCPSAQTLSVWCCWEEEVEVVRPVTRRDFHQMKQGNVGFPPH